MKYVCMLILAVSFTFLTPSVIGQTQNISVSAPFDEMDSTLSNTVTAEISQPTAEINNGAEGAERIMKALIKTVASKDIVGAGVVSAAAIDEAYESKAFGDKDFHCIFHILRWSPPDTSGKQTVQAQKWYLYHQGKLTLATPTDIPRLWGVGSITFLFIHLNKDQRNDYEPLYKFEVKKRRPAYVSHLLGLTDAFGGRARAETFAAAPLANWWGVTTLQLQYKISDITASAKLTRATAVEDLGDPQKFDNEGKYLMDVSVGIPIRKLSELSFDSVNNTVSPKEVDKTNVLAFVNVFPRPRDIRSNGVDPVPHFIAGVAIAKQPLHKIFVGAGFGPIVANFYIGAMFVKQEQLNTLQPGDIATPDQLNTDIRRKYKAQVAFGVNMPVGAIIEKLKGK